MTCSLAFLTFYFLHVSDWSVLGVLTLTGLLSDLLETESMTSYPRFMARYDTLFPFISHYRTYTYVIWWAKRLVEPAREEQSNAAASLA